MTEYKVGDRVQFRDDSEPSLNCEGTVEVINEAGQIFIRWDDWKEGHSDYRLLPYEPSFMDLISKVEKE